eukprot:TRINITY_DN29550_c0_g1_i1.p1 TRINITY_DN29550_c0_g1~~TRINITY_DN29550_c0_g1_i1.p1  ORF type:complete len:190 (-),score=46.81 TRINITY_DN29550_c0_g1_i1:115-684(-)
MEEDRSPSMKDLLEMPFEGMKRFVCPPPHQRMHRPMITHPHPRPHPFEFPDPFEMTHLLDMLPNYQGMHQHRSRGRGRGDRGDRGDRSERNSIPNPSEYDGIGETYERYLELDQRHPKRGVDPSVSRRMKRHFAGGADGLKTCQICLMNFSKGEEIMDLPCSHSFHVECISKWFKENKTCPVCRKEIVS